MWERANAKEEIYLVIVTHVESVSTYKYPYQRRLNTTL
nr:hypothetical protein [Vibrio alginolyticus]